MSIRALLAVVCLSQAAAWGAGETAVYVRQAEAPDYPGQVERIEVALSSPGESQPRVAVRFSSREGAFGFMAAGEGAVSLLTSQRRLAPGTSPAKLRPSRRGSIPLWRGIQCWWRVGRIPGPVKGPETMTVSFA